MSDDDDDVKDALRMMLAHCVEESRTKGMIHPNNVDTNGDGTYTDSSTDSNKDVDELTAAIRDAAEDLEAAKSDDTADEDDDSDVYVYECPETVTDDCGDEQSCEGRVKTSKDYGETLFMTCPDCGKEVTMIEQ